MPASIRPTRRQIVFGTVSGVLVAICLIFATVMRDAYRDVERTTALSAMNLAATVAHDVDRNIESLDLSLQAVTKVWSNSAVQSLPPALRDLVLFDNSSHAEGFGGIDVLDTTGRVRASSTHTLATPDVQADRDYFLVHKGSNHIGLFVSQPYMNRVTREWTLGLSRRIDNPDGSFGGVVIGTLRIAYLDALYGGVNLGREGTAALLRTDGTIVTRTPFDGKDIRRNIRNTDPFSQILSARKGSFEGISALDGKRRIISFHRVGDLPLIHDVEFSVAEAYADWRRKAFVLGGLLLSLCIGSLSLLVMLEQELKLRVRAEGRLERLANTDALTSLANRRQFEKMLDLEWARAQRSDSQLALLMIDADHFKGYNDTYGHLEGDRLLKEIAGCIGASLSRPGDLAARVGGEEFAVLLPDTDDAGAIRIAELIRCKVLELERPHPGSSTRTVTVSIGTASMRPRQARGSQDLIAAADAALYEAKGDGRNGVRTYVPNPRIALVA